MPRKDKKKKIKAKKSKAKVLKYSPIPPKGKPCLECGNKSGSAFTVPFGYSDLLGTQRFQGQPIININLAKPFLEERMPTLIKKSAETQTEGKKIYPSIPYIPLEEGIISLKPVSKNIVIKRPAEPFVGFEDIYNSPFESTSNISGMTTGEAMSEFAPPARSRRTDVEIVADLLIQNKPQMTYEDAIAAALELSKTKGALKDKKQQLKKSGK